MPKKRPRLNSPIVTGGLYFDAPPAVRCISSGCRTFDRMLGGGWAEGRVGNLVGDKSTGKTLEAIEICANYAIAYPDPNDVEIRFAEAEAAFDVPYAQTVGLPLERVQLNEEGTLLDTVEDFHDDLEAFCDLVDGVKRLKFKSKPDKLKRFRKRKKGGLYILDSIDALGDDDELNSAFGKDSYGAKKPKLIGQLFRRLIRRLNRLNITLIIVSQVRDKIGAMFGDKLTRSGGKALDFYCSQIVWLSDLGKIEAKLKGGKIKRKVGAWIRAKCKKNKVGLAWRECDFIIRYAFGIDDADSCLNWLKSVGALSRFKKDPQQWLKKLDTLPPARIREEMAELHTLVDKVWWDIERQFLPHRKKYA